jgi:proteasome assembly chaperone 2
VLLLQQRAPAIPGRQQAFASELAGWAASAGVRHVLLLCGLDAQYRREQQLEGPQLRYLPAAAHSASAAAAGAAGAAPPPTGELSRLAVSSEAGGLDASCASAGLLALEGDVVANERELHGLLPPWPLLDAAAERGLACTLLATFAAEGDNAQDGLQLAAKVVGVLSAQGLLPAQQQQLGAGLKTPCSWGPSLFGRQGVDSALF